MNISGTIKKTLRFSILFTFIASIFINTSFAQNKQPDTVKTGIYITSIHNIDFKQNEYTVSFWLWFRYKNKAFDFEQNLEIPQAKTVTKSYVTVDSSNDQIYLLMKLQCVMKDSWRIDNFPFDHQELRVSIENSQFASKDLVFATDTIGDKYDKKFTLRGWAIDSFVVHTGTKVYETNFGEETFARPHEEYSTYKVKIGISRDASQLFWKMFMGMYVAFLIAFICFFIHADNIDSRFGLSVGALFAAVGNKYIVDSSLPDSTALTLVDTLHGITLLFIFLVITTSAYALRLMKRQKIKQANRFDAIIAPIMLVVYVLLNAYLIWQAV